MKEDNTSPKELDDMEGEGLQDSAMAVEAEDMESDNGSDTEEEGSSSSGDEESEGESGEDGEEDVGCK